MLDIQSLQDNLPSLSASPEHSEDSSSSIDEAIRTSRALAARLFSDWHELNAIVQTHHELLQKRWRKRTREQKKAVLLKAWGHDMSESHQPDLALYIDNPEQEPSHSLDAYKWPYINLEDLLKAKVLPMFVDSRGRHHPYTFCHADLDACALGLSTGKIEKSDVKGYKSFFGESEEPELYGQIFPEKTNRPSDNSTVGFLLEVGQGLVVLEIQHRVWQFLLACAKELTHDVVTEGMEDAAHDSEQQPSSDSETNPTSLAANSAEASYQVPARFNIDRLKNMVAAKRSSIADHIWLLREDPSYFATCVNEWKEHQPEMLLDAQGKKHPIHKAGLTKAFWNRVLRKMVNDSYLSLSMWESTYQEVSKLDQFLQSYPDPSPLEDLPEELAFAMKKVRHLLELSATNAIALLKSHVPSSPPMLSYWHREGTSTADHHSSKFRMELNPRTDKDSALDSLFWVYTTLWDEKKCSMIGLHTLVGELDRLTYSDTKAKHLQSALVVDNIGDLGVIAECLHQLSLYYPWSKSIEYEMARNRQQLAEEFYNKSAEWDNFRKMPWQGVDLAELGSPGDGRFSYPISNRRTKTNVGALRKAEFQLDAFWFEVDKHLAAQSVTLPDKMMRLLLSGNRFLQRTSDWEEPVKTSNKSNGKNAKQNGKSSDKSNSKPASTHQYLEPFYTPLSATYLQLGSHKRHNSVHEPVKARPKDSEVLSANGHKTPDTDTMDSAKPTIKVDKRAKKVFSTLFFAPSSNDAPGDTTWTDFVHTMQSSGFAAEKLYASIWQFTPADSNSESIQFHAPHHVDKVYYHMARLYGRRLARTYGWHGDMFVLS